jgi:hypothetical protein
MAPCRLQGPSAVPIGLVPAGRLHGVLAGGWPAGETSTTDRLAGRASATAQLTPTAVRVTTSGPGTKPAGEACMHAAARKEQPNS